jgi:hypothetical protein
MFNKRETALSVMAIAAILVASFFAISLVQHASAQNATNMTSAGGANKTNATDPPNATSGANMTNATD